MFKWCWQNFLISLLVSDFRKSVWSVPSISVTVLGWGHFQNILGSRFWDHWGCRGQTNNPEIQNDENSKWKLVKTRRNPKFGLGDLENDLLTSTTSEGAQWIFPKNTFFEWTKKFNFIIRGHSNFYRKKGALWNSSPGHDHDRQKVE